MLSIFSKKTFLVDALEGFIDIHNHILPGIDDGAKTVEESIQLLKGFAEYGIHDFIATPHIMHNYFENNPTTINNAMSNLSTRISETKDLNVAINASAEHMIDSNFESLLKDDLIMPYTNNHLLIEMSYLQPPINFESSVKAVTNDKWLFPVLAHPERYGFLHSRPKKYGVFKKQNLLFQMNLLSLGGYYGKEVHKMALKLLEENMIDFLGSDVHNIHQLKEIQNITLTKKHIKQIKPIVEKTIDTFRS